MTKILYVGMDVHAETIAVAVAEQDGEVRSHGFVPNRVESILKLVGKLGPAQRLRVCYEAGPDRLRALLATGRAGGGL